MSMILIEVQDEKFQAWIKRTKEAFRSMIRTMEEVAEVVRENTVPITPVRSTRLGKSFKWTIVENNSKFQILQVRMSALNPRTGYDYAYVQHRGYHVGKHGYRVYYRVSSNFYDVGDDTRKKVRDAHEWGYSLITGWENGQDRYLYWGIRNSRDDAFEMIEQDYLSLFTKGSVL